MKIPKKFRHEKTIKEVEEYTYTPNGLKVLYVHLPGCDTVSSNIVYLVGSRHEERGKTGLAHMLEHMLFKNTKDKNGKKVAVPRHIPLQNKGALLNANTWIDRTSYYFVMPPEYLDEMLLAEAERMRGLIITPKEFATEQQNVLSEFEMYSERPDFALDSAVVSQAFVSHGYGHEVIGYKTDIQNFTCADLQSFYDTYYWPNNACLIIAGDIEREKALELVDTHFSHIPRSPKPIPVDTSVEPAFSGVRKIEITRSNPVTLVTLAYQAPRSKDRDWVSAYLLLTYLASGKLSPLYKKLVETTKVSSLSPNMMLSYDPYLMSINATVSQGISTEEVSGLIQKEIETLRAKRLKEKDLTRIKNKFLADTLYSRDGAQAVARELTEYVASGEWEKYYTVLEDIENTTVEDLYAAAQKLFSKDTLVIGTLQGA